MRIISGDKKGIILNPPKYFKDRPTTDLAKESLFNILLNRIYFDEISVLDLFSGTGSISYEFVSRGCTNLTAIDINQKYVGFINETFKKVFNDIKGIHAFKNDVLKYIKSNNLNYDLIFADPPYELPELSQIPDLIFNNPSLKNNSLIIIEHSKSNDFAGNKYFTEIRKYGKVNFSFFEFKKEEI
jgi:16S rRNA (guanine966-N2)-methyltransferase